jgi:hypothetical protein
MTQRRFGPTLGAGVAVVEAESDKPIESAQLGVTAYTGILEKGPVGKLFLASNKKSFLAKAGSYIPESLLPDCAFDFYNLSNGAGELWLQRIVDGDEKVASWIFKSRHLPLRKEVLKIEAGYQGDDNPGRWAGRKQDIVGEYSSFSGNVLSTGKTFLVNEMKDALVKFSAVPGKSFKVLANDASGDLTFASDVDLDAELAGAATQLYVIELSNEKGLYVKLIDGEDDPANEFGIEVYDIDGVLLYRQANLSMDPASARYVQNVVNSDGSNFYIKATDLNTGSISDELRPANFYGKIEALTSTVLTADVFELSTSAVADSVAELSAVTYGGSIKKDRLVLTCTAAAAGAAVFSVVSDLQGALADLTEGIAYTSNEFLADFTLGNGGADEYSVGDIVTIYFDPFPVNGFAGYELTPDYVNSRRVKFTIESNTVNTITVKAGNDMTADAAVGEEYMVSAPMGLAGGYDGIEAIADAEYIQAYDSGSSVLNGLFGQNKGLVKLATPGVTSTAVQKAGLAYAEARNYQYRVEVPSNITQEEDAEEYINDTIGRNDFGKVHFPSYGYVANPEGEGMKLVSLTGSFHGREAKVAKDFGGYHKVCGGIEVTLPNVLKLPTGDKVLNEEFLNPQGINVCKFYKGNAIMWGARSISLDPAFKFVQHREQLSHYENIFRESFDFIIFAINDVSAREILKTSFTAFFLPEFAKGAIRGDDLEDAVSIKIDDENNPVEEMAAGNLHAEIKVRLADTVERFIITISKAGIFEDLSA